MKQILSDTKIDFYGDQISWGRAGKALSLVSMRDLQLLAIALVGTALCSPPNLLIRNAALVAAANTFVPFGLRWGEKIYYNYLSPGATGKKCIETRPDKNTVPTLDKWEPFARNCRYNLAHTGLFIGALVGLCFYKKPELLPLLACVFATPTGRYLLGWRRWNKVAKGEWIVLDKGPPPERVKNTVVTWAGQLVPARVASRRTLAVLKAPAA